MKKKSNLSYLKTNLKPFAYCQIMPALVSVDSREESFDAHSLWAVLSNKQ